MLLLIVGLPLWALLSKGFEDRDGQFVGLANYLRLFLDAGAVQLGAATASRSRPSATLIVVPLAFLYAYALTRSLHAGCAGCSRAIALIPIFAPSLLPGLALIYLFGNQGFFKACWAAARSTASIGIVIAQVFYCFPHAR